MWGIRRRLSVPMTAEQRAAGAKNEEEENGG